MDECPVNHNLEVSTFLAGVILWILTAKLKFLLGICRWPLRTPTPLLYCLFCGPHRSHLIHFLTNIIFAITTFCRPFFLCIYLYNVNFSTANLLLNSYPKMCDTMFILIIPNLDVNMRPRPAANPYKQEKKTRKYHIYVMFQFAGNTIKSDAKITDLFPSSSFSVEGRGWLYTGSCQKQLKTLFCWLLLMHLWL